MTNVISDIVAYDVCRLCQIITFVAYDVCRIIRFVAQRVVAVSLIRKYLSEGKIIVNTIYNFSLLFFREYLRENEFLNKTILACLSGAQMTSIHEIKKCQKISWHCPFNGYSAL